MILCQDIHVINLSSCISMTYNIKHTFIESRERSYNTSKHVTTTYEDDYGPN